MARRNGSKRLNDFPGFSQGSEGYRSARIVGSGLWLFNKGFDTRDLKEAKALLDELSA
jgi:hypothetical protein